MVTISWLGVIDIFFVFFSIKGNRHTLIAVFIFPFEKTEEISKLLEFFQGNLSDGKHIETFIFLYSKGKIFMLYKTNYLQLLPKKKRRKYLLSVGLLSKFSKVVNFTTFYSQNCGKAQIKGKS